MMDLGQAISTRHSVRDFRPDPVPREVVERMIRAASAAPSSMNEQPWAFYCCVGDTRVRLGEIVSQTTVHLSEYMEMLGPKHYEEAVEWYSSLGNAPLLIAVSCPNPDTDFTAMNRFISLGAALENLLLTATAEGVSTCSITFSYWVRDEMSDLLGIPTEQAIAMVIAVGYAREDAYDASPRRDEAAVWLD